jgi:uncharacterized Zn-binding protein involved in type VI secretion
MTRATTWLIGCLAFWLMAVPPVAAQAPAGNEAPATPPAAPATGSSSVLIDGKPAQRLGDDPTTAAPGQPGAVEASPNVFIEGKPAVYCVNGVKSGSPNVFINGKPAARAGDCK